MNGVLPVVARRATWFGGSLILGAAFLIAIDVMMRRMGIGSVAGSSDVASFALAISSAWAFASVLIERAHIRVDTAYQLLPRHFRVSLDLLGVTALLVFLGLVSWYGIALAFQSYQLGSRAVSRVATPTWIPQIIWATGILFCTATAAALLARSCVLLARGRLSAVERILGPTTMAEEIEREVPYEH